MIANNLADQLVGALCNTLMHSLWQGIVLAAIAGLIVIGTRKTSSALRYNLLISALMLFAVAVSATFVGQYVRAGAATAAQPDTYKVHGVNETATTNLTPQPAPAPGFVTRVASYLHDYRNTIVMVWFLIICARSLQLGVGLYGTYRLKRVKVQMVQGHWPQRMRQLAQSLGITQSIALLESGLARTPMVIGHLKPVILVPMGLLTALSPQEIEAILIHELAHIKRRDYLVNMLQSGMEIVFFFNPAVLWISKLIRTERENCCDDLAVARDQNKANYIRALVSCEEYKSSTAPFAMAFPGGGHTLLDRVKRMVSNRNHSLNLFEKTMLAVCLVGAGLFMTAFSSLHHKPQRIRVLSNNQAPSQARPASTQPATTQAAPATPAQHKPAPPTLTPAQHIQAPVRNDTSIKAPSSESTTPQSAAAVQPVVIQPVVVQPVVVQPGMVVQPAAMVVQPAAMVVQPGTGIPPVSAPADTQDVDPYTNTGYNNQAYRSGYGRYADQQARYRSDEAKIKIDLIKEGLVSDTNHIHFTINEKEFILNGVRQSPEVFRRYRSKFDPTNGPAWSWTHGTER